MNDLQDPDQALDGYGTLLTQASQPDLEELAER